MRIYTRSGDDGKTGLIGGPRVGKDELRLEGIGAVDELNAAVGWSAMEVNDPGLASALRRVQSELFVIGAQLAIVDAGGGESVFSLPDVSELMVGQLEREIDEAEVQLEPLQQFILPGGSEAAARLHIARCICRRAERAVVAVSRQQPVPPVVLAYLNRLSDWLFIMCRLSNHRAGIEDIPWKHG
jgi:cob(I)alamin adenosyltransferase